MRQHVDSRQLSLVTESDANYTISASINCIDQTFLQFQIIEIKILIRVERIHFQKHPGQSDEYPHL